MQREGVVNAPILPVYARRDILQIRTDELLYGTKVNIIDTKERDRYWIETDYQYTGLVSSKWIMETAADVRRWDEGNKIVVTGRVCDVMSQPTVKCRVLLTLYKGSILLDLGAAAEPGWRCVRLTDGTEGFVRQEQVCVYIAPRSCDKNDNQYVEKYGREERKREAENEVREALVNTAYSYLGTPYRWGGKSTLGIDCSGFTFMVYALNGIYIHRDSAWLLQSPVRKIADCEKKPGDLLYFPGHIALYLGNGEYIHSTARDGAGVTINSLRKGSVGYRDDLVNMYLYAGTVF